MTGLPENRGELVISLARIMGIEPMPEMTPQILANFELAATMAKLLEGFVIDEREEPAPVFRHE